MALGYCPIPFGGICPLIFHAPPDHLKWVGLALIFKPHPYQREAIKFLITRKSGALFADPGLGKTVIALACIKVLKILEPDLKTLIIAPLRPMRSTWPPEIELWDQFRGLKCQILHGKNKTVDLSNDVFLVNPEGIEKALEQFKKIRPRMLIVDESSKFKNWMAKRTKLLKKHARHFDRRYIMTGTPAPNSYLDLFSQIFLVDNGETFGKSIVRFKQQYFHPTDYMQYNWALNPGAAQLIEERTAPFCLRLDGEKLLGLPDLVKTNIYVDLPPQALDTYSKLEKNLFAALDSKGHVIAADSSAIAYGMCRQVASGEVYLESEDKKKPSQVVHRAKIDALKDLIDEIGGKPVLIAYAFKHELARLKKELGDPPYIGGGVSAAKGDQLVKAWNNDELPILLVHPASVSHGLNLQHGSGRHIIWYSLTDDPEAYEQTNKRIRRQGVSSRVFVYHLLANGTIDQMILARLRQKSDQQGSLLDALLRYREGVTL